MESLSTHPEDAPRDLSETLRRARPNYARFQADLARFSTMFKEADAIVDFEDGSRGVDSIKLPASVVETYGRLMQHGYANDLIE